jgi:hypothetical protein
MIDENDRRVGLLDVPLTPAAIDWCSPFLNPFVHTAVLVRADVLRNEFGGYNENYRIAQDYDLWTRISAKYPTANLPDRLVAYRHLSTSLSKAGKSTAFAEADRVSAREAARVFGGSPSAEILGLLSAFRAGLDARTHGRFWEFYTTALRKRGGGMRGEEAVHRLKSAGAVGGLLAVQDVVRAFCLDPLRTSRWLKDRYC